MPAESGRKVAVGIGRETTRGTAVAPSYWPKHLELDFNQKSEKAWNESGVGVLDKYNSSDVVKDIASGSLGGKVSDRSFPLILAAACGQVPTSVQQGLTGIYDHTFAQSQANSSLALTLALKDSNRDDRYPLAMLSSLEISVAVGDWVKFTADFIAKKATPAAGNTVAYVAENEFKAKHVTIKLASTVAGLGAAAAIPVKEASLTIDRAVEDYMVVGSNDPYDIHAKEVEISGDMTLLYTDNTYRDLDFSNGYQALQLTLENTDVDLGGGVRPKIVLTFPRVSLKDWGLDQSLGNMIEQTAGLQGLYSQTDGYSMAGTATNLVASY